MRWLFVTSRFPWPIAHGHWLRIYHLARTLRDLGEDVSVLAPEPNEEGTDPYRAVGVESVEGIGRPLMQKGRSRVWLGPHAFDPDFAERIAEVSGHYDAVVLGGAKILQYSAEAASAECVIADYVDDPVLEAKRSAQADGRKPSWKQRLRRFLAGPRYESRFLQPVAATTFVSEADCRSFQSRHPAGRVACVPNGVDTEFFRRPESRPPPDGHRPRIVFTGHMSNPNNERAARFLVKEVMPHVWQRVPEAQAQIVGADPTDEVRGLAGEGVEVTGRVDNIRPYLWDASAVVLPMQSGTGIKNKLLEAWAAEAPVVATSITCQGVPAEDGANVLIADTASGLAQHVSRVIEDLDCRRKIARAGRKVVEDRFTWTRAAETLRSLVDDSHPPRPADG